MASKGRGQGTEIRGQRTEDRGRRTEDRSQRTEVRGQHALHYGGQAEVRSTRREEQVSEITVQRIRREDEGETRGTGLELTAASRGTVTVVNGPYTSQLSIGGMTVEQVRERFQTRLDLDPESQAVIDGELANENAVLAAGQVLMFMKKAGEKGMGSRL